MKSQASITCCFIIINLFSAFIAKSQTPEFEGIVTYKVEVKSKAAELPDRVMKSMLAAGDLMKAYIKNGNYRQSNGIYDAYFVPAQKKVYYKFRNLDTLYYRGYDSDTSKLLDIKRNGDNKTVAGYPCNSITIFASNAVWKYYYAPSLYLDPRWSTENSIGKFDTYARETSSVWLSSESEANNYLLTHVATQVEKKQLEENIFQLPSLPQKELTVESLFREPVFTRSGGWIKYLQQNLKAELGAKYIKIPKGQESETQQVMLYFIVSETGEVQNVKVMNPKEVHPKLAEEAIRVVTESGRWQPALIYGEKSSFPFKQPITFAVTK